MEGARGVLLSIAGGSDLGLFEINEAASLVQEAAHIDANIIFGTVIDDSLGDEVRVTVIAAGFDGSGPARRPVEASPSQSRGATVGTARAGETRSGDDGPAVFRDAPSSSLPPIGERAARATGNPVRVAEDEGDDDVDVPSFMRR